MHLTEETSRNMATVRGQPAASDKWGKNLHHLAGNDLYGVGELGFITELIGAAAAPFLPGATGAPTGGTVPGGPTTGMQPPGSGGTAVSPVFQTQISPQISPVFQQTQSSPGATQAATATQYMPGGMYGEGGSAPSAPPVGANTHGYGPSFPDYGSNPPYKPGGLPVSPLDPVHLTDIRHMPTAGGEIAKINQSLPFNWTPVYIIGGLTAAGLLVFAFMNKRKR